MHELTGEDLGLLEQELAKLAAYVGGRPTIEADDVRHARRRLATPKRLGRSPARCGAGRLVRRSISWTSCSAPASRRTRSRRVSRLSFAAWPRPSSAVREGVPLDAAVREVGVFPRELGESTAYLKRLGRSEALKLYARLLSTDVNLKGGLTVDERLVLEALVVQLGGASVLSRRN